MDLEYTVIPAPARGEKIRGARTAADRYAAALAQALNAMAAEGWEYVRAETLPSEERSGLTSRTTVWMNVLVFRRALPDALPVAQANAPAATAAVAAPTPLPAAAPIPSPAPAVATAVGAGQQADEPMRLSGAGSPAPDSAV